MTAPDQPLKRYRVHIRGHLDPAWSAWFGDPAITHAHNGTTTLSGPRVDQAAPYSLLGRLRDLSATLLAVERLPTDGRAAQDRPTR